MKFKRLLPSVLLAVLVVTALSACGPSKVDVALTTYEITPDKTSAGAGEVTFHVHNDATDLTHEFVVFKTDLPADQLPRSQGTRTCLSSPRACTSSRPRLSA